NVERPGFFIRRRGKIVFIRVFYFSRTARHNTPGDAGPTRLRIEVPADNRLFECRFSCIVAAHPLLCRTLRNTGIPAIDTRREAARYFRRESLLAVELFLLDDELLSILITLFSESDRERFSSGWLNQCRSLQRGRNA